MTKNRADKIEIKEITDIWSAYKRGTVKIGDIVKAPKGKGFVIYRGDGFLYDDKKKKVLYSWYKFKEGKSLPFIGRKLSFSTSIKIAKEFAWGIASHYGISYRPILIKAVCYKVEIGTSPFEKEIYPVRGKSKILKIEELKGNKK